MRRIGRRAPDPVSDGEESGLNLLVAEGLSVGGVTLGLLMIARTVSGIVWQGQPVLAIVPIYTIIPVTALLSVPLLLRSRSRWRDLLVTHMTGYSGVLVVLAVLNPILGMYFVHHRVYPSLDMVICIFAVVGVIADRAWSVGTVAFCSLAWILAAVLFSPGIPMVRFVFEVLTVDAVALVVYGARMRTLIRQESTAAELRRLASTDPLTGVLNLHGLTQRARRAVEAGTELAVIYLDLDGLKRVNDTQGHQAGDRMIVAVAAELRNWAGPGEVVARIGGDEFAVLQPGHGLQAVTERAAQLRVRLTTLGMPASIGVAAGQLELEVLLELADSEMYRDKVSRRRVSSPSVDA